MRATVFTAMLVATAMQTSCIGAGSCYSEGGIVDVCKPDFTVSECDDWDQEGINGSTWNYASRSCEALGYTVECSDGTWTYTSGDCG